MPREIADSDDEVEFAIRNPPKGSRNAKPSGEDAPPSTAEREMDPVLTVDFDGFYSPTQRISSFDGNNDGLNQVPTSNLIDSSTDRFLNEVAPAPSSVPPAPAVSHSGSGSADTAMSGKSGKKEKTGKKRSRTQGDDGRHISSSKDSDVGVKRTKTYGSSATSASNDLFRAAMDYPPQSNNDQRHAPSSISGGVKDPAATVDPADLVSIEERTQYTEPLDLSLHLSSSDDHTSNVHEATQDSTTIQAHAYIPPQPYTPHGSFFGANLHGGTTSKSSMGNYQSFSINPSALNMDYSKINPFASLTQVSLDGDVDNEDTLALANIFRGTKDGNSGSHGSGVEAEMLLNDVADMQTSPEKGASGVVAPEHLDVVDNEPPQASPSFSPITNADDEGHNLDEVIPEQNLDEPAIHDQPAETVEEPTKPPPKKRGRKPKQKKDDTPVNEDNDIDELHRDETPIPRGRAGTVDSVSNMSEISHATADSKTGRKRKPKTDMAPPELLSKKLPSSDLGLDNKAVIGLSPERYQPRPSKRRGRAEPEPTPEAAVPEEPVFNASEPIPEQETPSKPVPTQKGKKGKKSKVKRAKTSIPLRKSADFLDEDEIEEAKDVIFMDERPAKVKFQPLPEFSPDRKLKKEVLDVADEANEDVEEVVKSGGRKAKISIDVPVLAKSDEYDELPPAVPEPKKRGRKKKQVVEEPVVEPDDEEEEQQEEHRPALAEKMPNSQTKKGKNTKTSQAEQVADPEDEPGKENQTKDSISPVKTPPKPPHTTTTSKPTHSPIKPSTPSNPLFNTHTRLGLSKRHSIPSLLRSVNRNKEAPRIIERKEKVTKRVLEEREMERVAREEAEAEGREYVALDGLRGRDGRLVEWDF